MKNISTYHQHISHIFNYLYEIELYKPSFYMNCLAKSYLLLLLILCKTCFKMKNKILKLLSEEVLFLRFLYQ